MSEALRPCPFCGPTVTHGPMIQWLPAEKRYSVSCVEPCETFGPARNTVDEAIAAWNRRAADAERARVADRLALAERLLSRDCDMLSRLVDRAHVQHDEPIGLGWLRLMDDHAAFLASPPAPDGEGAAT